MSNAFSKTISSKIHMELNALDEIYLQELCLKIIRVHSIFSILPSSIINIVECKMDNNTFETAIHAIFVKVASCPNYPHNFQMLIIKL